MVINVYVHIHMYRITIQMEKMNLKEIKYRYFGGFNLWGEKEMEGKMQLHYNIKNKRKC